MSQYTTGEIAKLCSVSVRTVQFYDKKNILPPTTLTEGGRRLYSDEDLNKLRLICFLKSIGFSLKSIQNILENQNPNQILLLLLHQHRQQITEEIKEKQAQMKQIKLLTENIQSNSAITVHSMKDIENLMKNRNKLRNVHLTILAVGIILDVIQIGTLLLWIMTGNWVPFLIGMILVAIGAAITVKFGYHHTAYICPECNQKFKPQFKRFFFAKHTWKTRKLKCPNCGNIGYCIECYDDSK